MFPARIVLLLYLALAAGGTALQVDLDTLTARLHVASHGPVLAVAEYDFELDLPRGPFELTLTGGLQAASPLAAQLVCEGLAVDSTGLLWARVDSVYLELLSAPGTPAVLRVIPRGLPDWKQNWERRYPPEWAYESLGLEDVENPNEFPLRIRKDRHPPKVLVSRPVPPLPDPAADLEAESGVCGVFTWIRENTVEQEVAAIRFHGRASAGNRVQVKYRCATSRVYRQDSEYRFTHDIENGRLIGKYTFHLSGDECVAVSGLRVHTRSLQENVVSTCFWLSPGRTGRWNTPPSLLESWGPSGRISTPVHPTRLP